jgi:hypothetical protein
MLLDVVGKRIGDGERERRREADVLGARKPDVSSSLFFCFY